MIKVEKSAPTGFLGEILSDLDEKVLLRVEKRMLIAVKISKALKQNNISQKQFAGMMDKSTTVISEWLSGNRNFTVDTLADIEAALGIQLLNADIAPTLSVIGGYMSGAVKSTKVISFKTSACLAYGGQNYIMEDSNKPKAV